ncbi:MAG: sulfite exporter TauE/SafE family protein [Anaerolineae bacterium]|nr:sulfite exporter TauE/SafE family protein [Anaerolineae bacterium]
MTDTTLIVIMIFAGFVMGVSKGGMGLVMSGLITPAMSLVMPVRQAAGLLVPMALTADALAMYAYRRKWEGWRMRLLLPVGVLGVAAGAQLLGALPDDVLKRIIGAFALLGAIYKLVEARLSALSYQSRPWHALVVGGVSGLGSGLANAGSPPFTAYMLLQKLSPLLFVANTILFFTVIDVAKLPFFASLGVLNQETLLLGLWGVPAVPVGVWAGKQFVDRVNARAFDAWMLALLVVAGVLLIAQPG